MARWPPWSPSRRLNGARAETLDSALSSAYGANPTLNAQRASVRAVDENVARAKSGYRPTVTGVADAGGNITPPRRQLDPGRHLHDL